MGAQHAVCAIFAAFAHVPLLEACCGADMPVASTPPASFTLSQSVANATVEGGAGGAAGGGGARASAQVCAPLSRLHHHGTSAGRVHSKRSACSGAHSLGPMCQRGVCQAHVDFVFGTLPAAQAEQLRSRGAFGASEAAPAQRAAMLEDGLQLLLQLVACAPRPPGTQHEQAEMRSELLHLLVLKPRTFSELAEAAGCNDDFPPSPAQLQEAIGAVAVVQPGSSPTLYMLREGGIFDYNV
eukprot:7287208-Prymnesium_polylepis.1